MNETENPLLENSQSPKKPEKTLIINSVNNYDNKKEILQKVDDFFEDENKYLNLEEKIYVGKKPQGPRLDNNKKLIYYSFVGDPNLFNRYQNKQSIKRVSAASKMSENYLSKQKNLLYDILSNEELYNYYNDIKKRTKDNQEKTNEEYLTDLPKIIKNELINQQRNLEETQKKEINTTKLENLLMRRTNKKRENLLINNPDSYQIKRGILTNLEDKEPIELKMGDNNWYFNLRRPKKFKGIRDTYINIRTPENPFWGRFFETSPKLVSRNRKPIIKSMTYIDTLEKSPYLPKIPNGIDTIKEMKSLNKLEINGKNLLEFEKNLEITHPGKKKMYNRDQLETFDASKNMSQPEYEKYLHTLTEDHVYADDFNIKDYYRLKSGFKPVRSLYSSTEF